LLQKLTQEIQLGEMEFLGNMAVRESITASINNTVDESLKILNIIQPKTLTA
jgi:hypothetical protein